MDHLKAALIALTLALPLASGSVCAQQKPAGTPAAQDVAAEPVVKPAPPSKRKPIKRRSVQQIIEPTPPIVTEGYRPTLVVRPPPDRAAPSVPLPGQPRMNACDAGGCFDTNGARYNGGVGTTLLGPQGQLCTKGVVNAQCF